MQCISPINIRNPNGDGTRITVPCGKCYPCLSNRRNAWTFRLQQEAKKSIASFFITLTYEDGKTDGNVYKRDIQLFLKRFRKSINPIKFKYYLTSEYGTNTFRPHYHMLIFFRCSIDRNKLIDKMLKSWDNGYIDVGKVSQASIHYCTKQHISKLSSPDGLNATFCLMSKRPAIGIDYISHTKKYHRQDLEHAFVTLEGGFKQTMPRYYKDKLYTKLEKQILAKKYPPKDFVDRKRYFELNPTHTFSMYCKYLNEFIEMQQNKIHKTNKKDKL
nr:MAG: replication initiator protein [Microvirus sp.]